MNKELSKYVLNFADTKNNFPFAELALDHYLAFGGNDFEEILDLGTGIELLILAADIFDDIQDKDRPNAEWMKVDHAVSLNIATLIYTLALQVISSRDTEGLLLKTALKYIVQAMEGQHIDLLDNTLTEKQCIAMIKKKSGALTALASMLGAVLATKHHQPDVEQYAFYIGVAAQLKNDLFEIMYMNNIDTLFKKTNLAIQFLEKKFNTASVELLRNNFRQSELKQLLLESGVIHYMSVMINIYNLKVENGLKKSNLTLENKNYLINKICDKRVDENAGNSKLFSS
ncbi:polyprenyl synthetase family protein [Bacillus mojavensis]|uniref:Polyprenyl synthetase family protein n=1 Tax=Bacillus halotolerans TaxID=260554 RepID=A0ABY7HZC4_9BACI|nr:MULTISPECIES: polyprenyl synthetase family protein [Bacillus mojavensis subgroup]MEC1292368.1 polyprenyl synthetase family protein [Bacillus mojavensis]MEC1702327.1 polyprenyl synthetase family protein [Bacillus mojavensis]MEC5248926.1 polyprenyl synthetase family protein [Bacillus mojavensis]WAT20536.1 polyprenyl synthetase family protein [Bacillus halotolerans]